MGSDTFFDRANKPYWKPYCQSSSAVGILVEIAGHKHLGKAIQELPNMIKLVGRGFTRPKVSLVSQWVYNPLLRRIKLRLFIQALLFLMKVGGLLFKFPWPLSMFHITLKIMLCVVATAQVFMASNKLKSGIAGKDGLGKFLSALVFPLLAGIVQRSYGIWHTEIANWCMITFMAVYTIFLQNLLEKEGFKDVLLATTSMYALIGSDPFQEKVPEIARNLWVISQNVTNGLSAVKTLALFPGKVLTTYR
ncbi:MAG: hypothetical protein LBE98_04515 [Puniceicoccales bacterium]|jgi:hypothetical protein|nr:hypothetical protein [Puniceicoccales bacterium]